MSNLTAPPADTRQPNLRVAAPAGPSYVEGPTATIRSVPTSRWTLQVVGRGGTPVYEIPAFAEVVWERKLDDMSTCRATWATEFVPVPWVHELALYVDGNPDPVWAGPVVEPDETDLYVTAIARDLTAWWERWFVAQDYMFDATDLAAIFGRLASDAAAREPSTGMEILTHECGILGDRVYAAATYDRVSDKLRELARTAVDYTTVGRRILIGGTQVPVQPAWTLIDPMVAKIQRKPDGLGQANYVVVVGTPITVTADDGTTSSVPTVGIAESILGRETYGLLQARFDEPDIKDQASADVAAATRLALHAVPLPDLAVTLVEGQYRLVDLVPGARVEVALSDQRLIGGQAGTYRLNTVTGTVSGQGDSVVITLTAFGSD